ncbi:hypothetical protein DI09_51p120 [Mitosporidium daphniae]|uniref:leucine--tRNA ligase n=1 Tax=Mitosporidium daphniae TaxID=1485682 RepID=A0A098VT81_9MICR|nr:uncharacterized protein DI09_51p120 [Mitosporidium daphniae]KGG50886.1 hypothetical protein DI09_51p120 [Mitosporidium daphniae]|eukprot:XP_013237313.1 uncharacterized protein DI09_51p120 [Mitosporidium daphniae]
MEAHGIACEEIPKFADPEYWLEYFPPRAIEDLKRFGIKVDWRRSFITTDKNPYFDSFVRWQFNLLKQQDLVRFGKRYTIVSPKDMQPCQDHDRASGEGVNPQEYTAVLFRVVPDVKSDPLFALISEPSQHGISNAQVYLIAATLRPETLYGLTNLWASADIQYVAFRHTAGWIGICTERALLNGSYQGWTPTMGSYHIICPILGSQLMGVKVESPIASSCTSPSSYDDLFVLPFLNLLPDKGTGIVASVPSDSPDDYAALWDLRQKPALRAKFGISDEMVLPFEPIGIIQTQGYSTPLLASELCATFNIRSQNDKEALAKAKALAYKDGFYSGIMLTGPYKGQTVADAKPLIKADILSSKKAISYCEPEGKVVARTGDECVVALMDQWYIAYGEPCWKEKVVALLGCMELFHEEARHQMDFIINWLGQWACARSFGLGSRLPWDTSFLVESLSDSTIYMAYYTVSHFLQNGSLDGSGGTIAASEMTGAVWSFLFNGSSAQSKSDIPKEVLASSQIPPDLLLKMKREFSFWYPMDLRVSGKDLLFNHLTFMLYAHCALFPKPCWPKGMRVNGHLLLNAAKMSKSTGNFMTLSDALDSFSADATRFALADAGDTLDDANFSVETANAAVLKLHTLLEWMESVVCSDLQRTDETALNVFDKIMLARMDDCVQRAYDAYDKMLYREALKWSFHELTNARDRYRELCSSGSTKCGLHTMVINRYIRIQAILMYPITSHFSEYILALIEGKEFLPERPRWPATFLPLQEVRELLSIDAYAIDVEYRLRIALGSMKKGENALTIIVAKEIPSWQKIIIELLESLHRKQADFPHKVWCEEDSAIISRMHAALKNSLPPLPKEISKKVVPWMVELKKRVESVGPSAFNRLLLFDEMQMLDVFLPHLRHALSLPALPIFTVEKLSANQGNAASPLEAFLMQKMTLAIPGEPAIVCYQAEKYSTEDLASRLQGTGLDEISANGHKC